MLKIIKQKWQKSFLRQYLIELIEFRIEIYHKKYREIERNEQIMLFRNLRWEEILNNTDNGYILKKLPNNIVIQLPTNAYLSKFIYFDEFEKNEIDFIQKILRTDDVFIDIGANIGLFSLYASTKIKSGKILAFEPTPATYKYLKDNIELNNIQNCMLYEIALADTTNELSFSISMDGYDAFNGFSYITPGLNQEIIKVKVDTLDNIIADNDDLLNKNIIVKIDVEGWELSLLKGAKQFLSIYSPLLLIEFTDENAIKAGFTCRAVYEFLTALGYSWFEFIDGNLIDSPLKESYPYNNLIATRRVDLLKTRLNNE